MLERDHKNRLLVGIGKAQYLLLDLGREFMVELTIAGGGEIAAVVVELGQDFAQLCFPTAIRCRPHCQAEDLTVISPVKHSNHPRFLANCADAAIAPCGDSIPVSARYRRNHLE